MNFRKVLPLSLLALVMFSQGAHSLITGRHAHTATLLPDGNFIVIGGVTAAGNVSLGSSEIYFTSAAAYGSGAPIPGGFTRSSHTATLMGDGRVLLTGGFSNGVPQGTAYIYDSETAIWVPGPITMKAVRGGHTATLINKGRNAGNVIICGGQASSNPLAANSSCEIFFTTSTSFGTAAPMSSERIGHTASAIAGGRVFIAGGMNSAGTYLPNTEIYDPENNQWQPGMALVQGRVDHSATVLNTGNVLISGGYNGSSGNNAPGTGANKIDDPEEVWYRWPSEGFWSNQNPGTHGYLESAEIFGSDGSKVPVSGKDYLVMPYRNSQHSAALSSDGRHHMYGGYGNIVPTFVNLTPTVEPGSHLDGTHIFTATANILGSSDIKFLLDAQVARPVDGRVVDGDLYLSYPPDRTSPSITVANANIFLNRSTAPLYGSPLGYISGGGREPGSIYHLATLFQPAGLVSFSPQTSSAEDTFADGAFRFAGGLSPGQTKALIAVSSLTMILDLPVPKEYVTGTIIGSMTLTGGTITDDLGWWALELKGGTIDFSAVADYDSVNRTGHIQVTAYFPVVEGMITNTTTTILAMAGANAEEATGVTVNLNYTSSFIDLAKAAYSVDKSTIVLREVIFADNLEYVPAKGNWEFGTPLYPIFNQTILVTPGADYTLAGGRNCEAAVAPDCQNKTFTARNSFGTYIFRNVSKWPEGKKLNNKRAYHTSTLLPDGRILTCGGFDGVNTLPSCELLNPVTQEWAYTGSMNFPRTLHTATLLPNGRVLAVGGAINASTHVVTSAEIYYPDTGRWVPTSSMAAPRSNHTATLLPDGNVLVAGGDTINGFSNAFEIYITTGAVWQPAFNTMSSGRAQHTATLLKNGNVMLAGGINGSGALATSDIYTYANRGRVAGPVLNTRRYAHAANLLMDGRVMVSGGTDNTGPLDTAEIYNGSAWQYTTAFGSNNMLVKRAHHRSTLLPNGKLMITGGEAPGTAYGLAEGYDVDFATFQAQGAMINRVGHSSLLTSSSILVNIGGWDGAQYLDSTEGVYFSATPDADGFSPTNLRNPVISTGTTFFDRAERATLLSNATNFHGFSEASGGGSGSMNASFHNPRVYIQQIDNPSGFLTDLTTRLYTLYSGPNADWEKTLSSITVIAPSTAGEMPYGWYHMRVAANGQFSNGHPVQVTIPRPTGLTSVPLGAVQGTSSITWTWNQGSIPSGDGYALYASSNNVFITTVAFTPTASYTQTGLQSNTAAGILVNSYNLGGAGPLAQSATYYTLASSPTALTIMGASFETAGLAWNPNGNSRATKYEITMSPDPAPGFTDPLTITTPIPFSVNYASTGAVITQLSPNEMYYFRVTAINGAGILTAPSNIVSTITVGNVVNLTGTALSTASISWSWDTSAGASFYEVYDIAASTTMPPFISSTTLNYMTQSQGLSANMPYSVGVNAVKNTVGGPVTGPRADSAQIYTLAIAPLPNPTNAFTNTSTGSFTVNWITNGNSGGTVYEVNISPDSLFTSTAGYNTTGNSLNFSSLAANTRYYARIRAFNGDGIATPYVLLGSKYTRARVPTGVTPATISMSGVTLTWDANNNPDGTLYEVRGSTDNFSVSITTYARFDQLFSGRSLAITGLMTATSYYFDVAARNGELYDTARIQAVPVAFTLPGAGGAPAGSIGGTSDPSKLVTIQGTLPNNREVTLSVPAGSFPKATGIAISSSITSACGTYSVAGRTVEVAIYSEAGAQPDVPVTLTLKYECTMIPGPDVSKLVIARYNPVSGTCLPLDTKIDPGNCTITSTLNHFSVFQLMLRTAASDLSGVIVYPNPFYTNRGNGFVTIDRMPAASKVRIYTLSGEKIWEGTAGATGILIWSGVNKAGELAASGVYLAVIDSSAGKKVLKLAVER